MTYSLNRRALLKRSVGVTAAVGLGNATFSAEQTGKTTAAPAAGLPLAQDYTVIFHNSDRELYVEGCGLTRLSDGTLIAVVPVIPRKTTRTQYPPLEQWRCRPSRSHILRSTNGGKTWEKASELPYFTAIPWMHDGDLYLFTCNAGTTYRNDDLFLHRSRDGGNSWSDAVRLFKGHFWNCHTGMVQRDDRLYWAIDEFYGKNGTTPRSPIVIAGDLTSDPLNPQAWRRSNHVPFPDVPAVLANPAQGEPQGFYLEPNVVEVNGELRVIATVKINAQATAGLAAVMDFNDDGKKIDLSFRMFHPMPVGQLKFCAQRDEMSRLLWCTGNIVVDSQKTFRWSGHKGGNDRRFLTLWYGLDGINWFPAGCIAQAATMNQSFMYGAFQFDGNDLAVIARSSVNGPSHHDADCATFHRVKNFRNLALDLVPKTG